MMQGIFHTKKHCYKLGKLQQKTVEYHVKSGKHMYETFFQAGINRFHAGKFVLIKRLDSSVIGYEYWYLSF